MTEQTAGRKIFVGNLSYATTEEELYGTFQAAGDIERVSIIQRNLKPLGFGFVTYRMSADAERAVATFHGKRLAGRKLKVAFARIKGDELSAPAPVAASGTLTTEKTQDLVSAIEPKRDSGEQLIVWYVLIDFDEQQSKNEAIVPVNRSVVQLLNTVASMESLHSVTGLQAFLPPYELNNESLQQQQSDLNKESVQPPSELSKESLQQQRTKFKKESLQQLWWKSTPIDVTDDLKIHVENGIGSKRLPFIIMLPFKINWKNYFSVLYGVEQILNKNCPDWSELPYEQKYHSKYEPTPLTDLPITKPLDRIDAMWATYKDWENRDRKHAKGGFIDEREVNNLVATMGPPGIGKSFYLSLIAMKWLLNPSMMNPSFAERMKNAFAVPITFNSGFEYDVQDMDVEHRLSLRFLYSYFAVIVNCKMPSWKIWLDQFYREVPSLDYVVSFMREHFWKTIRRCDGLLEQQHVVLLVDEIIRLARVKQGDVIGIEYAMTRLGSQLQNRQVHVVISSLSMYTLESTTPNSKRGIRWIPLAPLSIQSVMEMFEETLFLPTDSPGRKDKLTVARYLLYSCGGHPRIITYLYAYLKEMKDDAVLKADMTSFVNYCLPRSKPLITTPKLDVIKYALSGKKVTLATEIGSHTVDQFIAHGQLINNDITVPTDNFVPRILPLQLCSSNELHETAVEWMMKYSFDELKDGKPFERFFAGWLFLISNLKHRLETFAKLKPRLVNNGGVPFSGFFYPESEKENAISWGPKVPIDFCFDVLTVTDDKEFPPRVVQEEFFDNEGNTIYLNENTIILCGNKVNPSCDHALIFKDIDGHWNVIFVNAKYAFSDTRRSFSVSGAKNYLAEIEKIMEHLLDAGYYNIYGCKIHKDNVYFCLVSLHERTKTEMKDRVFVLGRTLLLSAFTPSLNDMALFVATT